MRPTYHSTPAHASGVPRAGTRLPRRYRTHAWRSSTRKWITGQYACVLDDGAIWGASSVITSLFGSTSAE